MTFRLVNRVRMSLSGAAGAGALTLNTAAVGFQSLAAAGMLDGDSTPYLIEDGSPVGSVWEIGQGSYHSNGTFTRDTITQSSAGGATPISVTANAILSGTLRAQDLMAAVGAPGSTAPAVVQHAYILTANGQGDVVVTLGGAPTVGNLLVAIGNCPVNTGADGFNWTLADTQFNQNSTTAYKVGYGFRTVRSGDSATQYIGTTSALAGAFSGVLIEISGANLSLLTENEGALGATSTSVEATNPANCLSIFFAGGDGAADPSITSPSGFQVSYYGAGGSSLKAGWNAVASAGSAGVVGSVASGTTRALALNLPGA